MVEPATLAPTRPPAALNMQLPVQLPFSFVGVPLPTDDRDIRAGIARSFRLALVGPRMPCWPTRPPAMTPTIEPPLTVPAAFTLLIVPPLCARQDADPLRGLARIEARIGADSGIGQVEVADDRAAAEDAEQAGARRRRVVRRDHEAAMVWLWPSRVPMKGPPVAAIGTKPLPAFQFAVPLASMLLASTNDLAKKPWLLMPCRP